MERFGTWLAHLGGFDANLANLGFLLTIGFQIHSKHLWYIYKPVNNNFRVRQSKIILFPTIIVCNFTVIWCFLLNLAPKFDLWTSLTLLDSTVVWITHFLVQISHTYHPQENGTVKSFNKILKNVFLLFCGPTTLLLKVCRSILHFFSLWVGICLTNEICFI